MSQTKFDNITRSALWNTYSHQCFYCKQPLEWDNLHIDHVIPEALVENAEVFERLKKNCNLRTQFSVNSIENLVPAHAPCNQRKSDMIFDEGVILFYLQLTKNKVQKVNKEIEIIKKKRNKSRLMAQLQVAFESGMMTINEAENIINQARENNWIITEIELPVHLDFVDGVYDAFYYNSDFSDLYDRPILFGKKFTYIELLNDNGEIAKICTLREWETATKQGFYPATTFSIKMSDHCVFMEELLQAITIAKMPKHSFINDPWIGLDNLDFVSPRLLHCFEAKNLEKHIADGASIGDMIRDGSVIRHDHEVFKVQLEYGGMFTFLSEQFRADFNNDGIEDIFIKGWACATAGTLGYGFTNIITRNSPNSLLVPIS